MTIDAALHYAVVALATAAALVVAWLIWHAHAQAKSTHQRRTQQAEAVMADALERLTRLAKGKP